MNRLRLAGVLGWATILAAYLVTMSVTGRGPLELLSAFLAFLRDHPVGPLVYVAAYAFRPIIVFSSTLLSVGAGMLYGPVAGIAVVLIGANLSGTVAYLLGRTFGAELAGRALDHPRLAGVAKRLREYGFETVLTLRLAFVPYDAVNYLAGTSRIPLRSFVTATALGILPGAFVFVLFGAGAGDPTVLTEGRLPTVSPPLLAASGVLLLVTLTGARIWRKRMAARHAQHEAIASDESLQGKASTTPLETP